MTTSEASATPFHDLGDYMALPRVGGLRLSPDGAWLATAVQTLSVEGKKYVTSIWRIDAAGAATARRLTRSAEGEGGPRFLPDGSLLFTSKRADPDADADGKSADQTAALWVLPPDGGEARAVVSLPGGVAAAEVAADAGTIVVSSQVLPAAGDGAGGDSARGDGAGGDTAADDARLRKERKDAGVTAILHESVPVRYWDHDLGPAQLRLFAVESADSGEIGKARDLTPEPGRALDNQPFDVTPDGTSVVTGWRLWLVADTHDELAMIDVASGKRRTLLSAPGFNFGHPRVSPDGRYAACLRETISTAERPVDITLFLVSLNGDTPESAETAGRDLLPGLDRWPDEFAWAPDSRSVYFTADDHGREPVFVVALETGDVTRLTADHGAYSDLNLSPDGRYLYAMRAAVDEPPTPVRIDLRVAGAEPVRLASPGTPVRLPGRLEEIETAADDGHPIRSWLVLPESASADHPAPLLLWVHGGPMMSWNSWSWRWNPWLMVARGYAVLLPDPALSSGYGQDFVARGYHSWGPRPFADVMAATDAALERPDLDASRTGMMGGSYGGYMANWIAGHTDRFKAIVSHAGLWVLDQMFGTTDGPMFWRPQFGDPLTAPEMYELNSPHRHIESIRTPMLVIHSDKDYRVPISEALRLWWDLSRYGAEAKFLYFPDENHWILTPGNATVWYETVFAFLAQHVLGEEWRRPELL